MTALKAPRGRPKGTGINDQQRLAEIARLMASDPHMKPTTAIKILGITDPSAIRRLRDKFNATSADPRSSAAVPMRLGASRVAALKFSEPVKRFEPVSPSPAGPAPVAATAPPASVEACPPAAAQPNDTSNGAASPAAPTSIPVAALLFGYGLTAAATFFEQQMLIAQSVMRLPPVRDLVRQQIALTEFMLSVARQSPGPRGVR